MKRPSRRGLLRGAGALVAASALAGAGVAPQTRNRFLALGDSYTAGTGVAAGDGWVPRLAVRLRENGIPVAEPVVVARAGWTTADLAAGIEARAPAGRFDLVTLSIGANDAVQGRDSDAFRRAFESLLGRAVRFGGGDASNVVVLTIPDYTVTPAGELLSSSDAAPRLESFNRVVREATSDRGARLVDVVPISRQAAVDPSLVSDDGLHPSAKQYRRWLTRIYPAVVAALER